MRGLRTICLPSILLIIIVAAASAQTRSGMISGRVLNEAGTPIRGCSVTLFDSHGSRRLAITDASGSYRFEEIGAGRYEIFAESQAGKAAREARISPAVDIRDYNLVLSSKPEAIRAGDASATEDRARPAISIEEAQSLKTQIVDQNRQIEKLAAMVQELKSRLDANETTHPAVVESKIDDAGGATGKTDQDQAQYERQPGPRQDKDKPKSVVDQLIRPKLAGGQFAGSEGLLKSDRVKLGGYADFRYVTRGLDEGFEIRANADEANPGRTATTNFKRNTFIAPRAVIALAAAITPNLLFNSEIEFEFAGKEVEVEQAYLEYRFDRRFSLRGGVIVPPLGRFNLFHDSNLQDIVTRPLVSTFVIPSTYKDAGIGALGSFKIGQRSTLGYEVYIVNGLRSDEGGEFAREGGLFESKGNNRFFDNNPQKSIVGRVNFSPVLGVELGASGYRGKHDNQGLYNLSIWALDWKLARGGFQILGEYARASVQRPAEDESEIAAREFLLSLPRGDYRNTFEFFDQNINEVLFDKPSRSLDGFYVEARYRFRPKWWTSHLEEDASIAPVVRFDQVNLDRQFPGFSFPLNMRRTSVGLSLRPTEAASINFAYHFDKKPDLFLRLPDSRPFPPYFTNLGIKGFSLGLVWAF
ncbi:MAG: hypothetical protein DMF61_09080 [Blastocatellia bacterium AA13]|nr:MAG: hypothetical protein DMF61_09080 [Blastocatellia bacterium AA13]